MRLKHYRGFWRELRVFMRRRGFNPPIRGCGRLVYFYGIIGGYCVFTATPKRKSIEMGDGESPTFMRFSQKGVIRRRELEHMRLEEHKRRRKEDQ